MSTDGDASPVGTVPGNREQRWTFSIHRKCFSGTIEEDVIATKWPWVFAEILSFFLHFHPHNRSVCLPYFVYVSEGVRILKAE